MSPAADQVGDPTPSNGELSGHSGLSGRSAAETDTIASDAVRSELRAILADDSFRRSERCSRLLQALVEHTLAGRAGELKEYSLAIEVFDRKPSFDPRVDPIVRVEVGRLRRKLEAYYKNEGRESSLRITVPLRQHVAVFTRKPPAQPASIPEFAPDFGRTPKRLGRKSILLLLSTLLVAIATVWEKWPAASGRTVNTGDVSIAVLPFSDLSPGSTLGSFSDALTEEIIEALGNAQGVRVVSRLSSAYFKGRTEDVIEIGRRLKVRYVLEGSVNLSGGRLRVIARLINAADGYRMWSRGSMHASEQTPLVEELIARMIVQELRQHLGLVLDGHLGSGVGRDRKPAARLAGRRVPAPVAVRMDPRWSEQ